MAQFIPMAAGAAREAHRGRQERIETENATLANDPNAFAAVLAEREKTMRRRMQLGCGGALVVGAVLAGAVGYGIHQVGEIGDGVKDSISDAYDKVKPDTKVEISAEAAIEKVIFPEDLPLVDGDATATTGARVKSEVPLFNWSIPETGLNFGYESGGTVGLELVDPGAITKEVVNNTNGTKSLALDVEGSEIQASLESFQGNFITGSYDEGEFTERFGSEGDTVDRAQLIADHAQTTLIGCKTELVPFVTEGLQRRALEQIDDAIETARMTMKPEEFEAYFITLSALREQPIIVRYHLDQVDKNSIPKSREITEAELPLPNKPNADGIVPHYITNGQLAVGLDGEENEVQSATCKLANNIASPAPIASPSPGQDPSTSIIPNEGFVG